ncbi:hypothetical protein [Metabacillus bambusae]|uniref:Glycerophosphoryl diester phosphodiesterase membrane domain-containing protein n=1 Tax=Metabacillus bambusae TaxID=2795218 RepID=A0ABS3N541_9BACI|nr:hypothetical protein [Metabacillus bambusae]MBO1513145.1 hypothetical protein [Metabacillus bambusae]
MNTQFNKPKGFGEILDHTFRLSKNRFSDFFMILLLLIGPIYVLEAIILMVAGTSFFREGGTGSVWYERMISRLDETAYTSSSSLGADIGFIVIALVGFILFPVAQAAILFAVNHIRKNEEYTVGSVIKKAFTRFWPILGSSILFGLIVFGLVIVPIIVVSLAGFIGATTNPVVGILLAILLFLGFAVGVAYLLTRWSFYFCSVVLQEGTPGFSRSWRLTSKRTWVLLGLYIIFSLIISSISAAVELSFGAFLGYSVLLTMIVNVVSLFTTMIFSVGYAVMYFDLKIRHDADDLKEMIEDYKEI